MKYFVIPETRDGCDMPTWSEPLPLDQISAHIEEWIKRYERQGYYSNCNHERLVLDEMTFRLVPDPEEAT